ncbi:MAG: T9SS type A sorting domain-containing protein [Bacteroidia bacterium]|nr:T9SS type A sorting domain-containing protein [Bacteroidia bacterium]
MRKIILILMSVMFCKEIAFSQEKLVPLNGNINLMYHSPQAQKNNSLQKVTALYDTLPFFEDFYYASRSIYPSGTHWTDSSVYVNTGFAIAPPSIGVATFDGLNRKGYPYNLTAQPVVSAAADTLTSRPISLGVQSSYTYSAADSLALTFLYQRGGFGENPEVNDSLIVDFYKPLYPVVTGTVTNYGAWFRVWSTKGSNSLPGNDTMFKRAFIRIKDTAYFHNGFKFRFRNKATTSGSVDHWNVDYINLKKNYLRTDTVYDEVALGYMPRPILKNYSALPYYQYQSTEMGTKFSNFIRNNAVGVVKNTNYEYAIMDENYSVLHTFGGSSSNAGNVNPFVTRGWDSVATHKSPPVNYTISPFSDSSRIYVRHIINSNPDVWKYNDTIYQKFELNNYYAYDDGSAEAGYYLNTYGAKLALRFTLNVTDTLHGLDIYFNPITQGNLIQATTYRMYLWSDGGGSPGTVIRRDSVAYPKYLQIGHNQMPRYFYTTPIILNPGTYYCGIVQTTNQQLNIGFDRNFDHKDALYYDVSGFWQQSAIPGSIMIHPIVGPSARALVGIKETENKKESSVKIYPNPTSDKLFIETKNINECNDCKIELYSVLGNKLNEEELGNGVKEIALSEYAAGMYFIVIKQNNKVVSQNKFIISR